MNALCSLSPTTCIRFVPKEKRRPVLLKKLYGVMPVTSIRMDDGVFIGIAQPDGWMLINHPREGLVGLPLEGKTGSWHAAWEEELVDIQCLVGGEWQEPVYDWTVLKTICVQN